MTLSSNCYPKAPTAAVFDTIFATQVADPFRPLEDLDAPAVNDWLEAQRQLTAIYHQNNPLRLRTLSRLGEIHLYDRFVYPILRGDKQFFFLKLADEEQFSFYFAERNEAAAPTRLIDAREFAADTSLLRVRPSPDGRFVAYALSQAGSDWQTWRVRDVATGKDLKDVTAHVKFSLLSWRADSRGYFYSGYDAPTGELFAQNLNQKVFHHALGRPQEADDLIYSDAAHPDRTFLAKLAPDGRFLVLIVSAKGEVGNQVLIADLQKTEKTFHAIVDHFDGTFVFVGAEGNKLWFRTDYKAEKGRLLAFQVEPEDFRVAEVIGEREEILERVTPLHGGFLCVYLIEGETRLKFFSKDGSFQQDIALPEEGMSFGFDGSSADRETYFNYTDFVRPSTVYHLDLAERRTAVHFQPRLKYNPGAYQTERVHYESNDGCLVPLYLVYDPSKPLERRPTLLYAYGGFGFSLSPSFSPLHLWWLEQGGIYAVAGVRGGGEYGEAWHRAGMGKNKANSIKDIEGAADFLIEQDYTTPEQLCLFGRSNGALLMAAVASRRPRRYAACALVAGLYDLLRYDRYTVGWSWSKEYGDPAIEDQFHDLLAWSPLHNIVEGSHFPSTILCTGRTDDRVPPAHSYKFAAALQTLTTAPRVLLNLYEKTGHGGGRNMSQVVGEQADILSFLWSEVHGSRGSSP